MSNKKYLNPKLPYFEAMSLFELKIKEAKRIIRKAYEDNNGKIFISYSGGKDSTVLRHLALSMYPELKVVFSNTTNELSEVLQYVKKTPNVIAVLPEMSFKQVVKTHGFPIISKETSQKVHEIKHTNGKKTRLLRYYGNNKGNSKLSIKWRFLADQPFDVTNKCCTILKKRPLEKWAKEQGLIPLIALMQDESRLRSQLALYGADDGKKIYPFLKTSWTESDIWLYAEVNNIRFAECYYDRIVNNKFIPKRTRTGCEYCAFGIAQEKTDRFERSKILTPKRYEMIMNLKNNGVKYRDAIKIALRDVNTSHLNIFGGSIEQKVDKFNDYHRLYAFTAKTKPSTCPCCGSKDVKKDIAVKQHFLDTPHPNTSEKRSIVVENHYYKCSTCKMSFLNDLHMFNHRFAVTKRLIDYIYSNINNMSAMEVSERTGLNVEEIYDILMYCKKEIKSALLNNQKTIWFDVENNLVEVA